MIKFLIPELLYFDTGHFVDGKQIGRGYYFKGKFISQYKSLMIEILRQKFNNDYSDENKKKFADEWKVIHYFSEISTRAVKKTNEKKKPYYEELRRATELGKMSSEIEKLRYKIHRLEKDKQGLEALKKTYEENLGKMQQTLEQMKVIK